MIPLEIHLGERLKARGLTIATAESCTGGLITHRLTEIAGSSAYVLGGIVAYSNQAKQRFLGVQEQTLIAVGAVSEPVAREMALGVQAAFGCDCALSVTGIAGPGGGTDEKPVGLTYIGVLAPSALIVRRYVWNGTRSENKAASADQAMRLLLELLD